MPSLKNKSRQVILVAILASLLEIIDSSIVNVAIPTMMGNLGTTLENISWVVTGYIIANAIVLPISGWLGMQFGRKQYYVSCIIIFTIASLACGIAPNLPVLVIFRVFQGLAGGALLPTSQALIQEQFPREKAGTASAVFGLGVIIGPTIGPTLGGYLTDSFGWRAIFNINLPLGILAAMLAWIAVEDVKEEKDQVSRQRVSMFSMDWVGMAFLIVGVGCMQYVLERGQADDWFSSNAIKVASVCAVVALPSLVFWEIKRARHPILDLRLFKHAVVRGGTILMLLLGMMLYAMIFIIPVFVTNLLGFTAMQIGLLFIPGALTTAFCMPIAGKLLQKTDPRVLVFFGILSAEFSIFLMSHFSVSSGGNSFFWPLIVRGVAMGFLFVPINTMVLGQFKGAELGNVAGLQNLFRQLGGSIGIASLSTLLDRLNAQNYLELISKVTLLDQNTYLTYQSTISSIQSHLASNLGFGDPNMLSLKTMYARVMRQVLVIGINQIMTLLLIAFGLSVIPLFLIRLDKSKLKGPVLDAH